MLTAGSIWRRWDLHVHTPDTILNDQFGSWSDYLDRIEQQSDVKVIGVTDYMCLDNYSRLRKFQTEDGRIKNIELLIPNLEFRIAPPSEKATAVNLHLLISPHDQNHEQKIREALARLTWEYDWKTYSCLPEQLIQLGRSFNPDIEDERQALKAGTLQFKVDFTAFRNWYEKEHWLKHNSIVAVAAGKDGLAAFRREGAWAALRDEISRFSSIIFSGRDGEIDFWLGRKGSEYHDLLRRLGGPKPCVHGSDAHEMAKLFQPDKNRFCWIKADPTFDGLRQILLEPEDRIFIGQTPPTYHNKARVIQTVRLKNSSGWFDDIDIPLNPGLVSVIGPKGSGKSALAELIAFAAGSWSGDDSGCFLSRAETYISGMTVELTWADGSKSSGEIGRATSTKDEVRYLSQRFVEYLCAGDHIGAELIHEIENVIFSYIDSTETLGASDFSELRSLRTVATRAEIERLREDIKRLIREEFDLRENAAKIPEKKSRIVALAEERKGLHEQIPKPSNAEEERLQAELRAAREALAKTEMSVSRLKQTQQKVLNIRSRIGAFSSQMTRFQSELEPSLREIGIDEALFSAFVPSFPANIETVLAPFEDKLLASLNALEGNPDSPAEGTLVFCRRRLSDLMRQETEDKASQEKLKIIQSRLTAIDTEVDRIQAEIAQIEGPENDRLRKAREERFRSYVGVFENLKAEQKALERLYAPVSDRLREDATSVHEQRLEFSIRWEADIENWLERGGGLFDQRKKLPYETMEGIAAAAKRTLLPAWVSGNPDRIRPAMDQFLIGFRQPELPPSKYLRSSITIKDIYEWLYEVEHIKLNYGLKYNGADLSKLSPGTKGIVLLILYLGMDLSDTRPLIVDQPDENLDNESIYTLLSTYFKTAKNRRQIILITHNPNLVVNADSEQVIVAENEVRLQGYPYIKYSSGGLEDTTLPNGIRSQVCRILEGGAEAFLRRERRYGIDTASLRT